MYERKNIMSKEGPKIIGDNVVNEKGEIIGIVSRDGSLDYATEEERVVEEQKRQEEKRVHAKK